jgi:alpha-L-rhamnosidase
MRAAMTERLVKDIEAHQNHLTTGFLGTPFLMFVLDENGRSDVAYRLLLQDTYPSWGYMVRKGATTWWERWNGDTGDPAMNSYNHYAFGSVMAWVFRRVAGIDTDPSGAGFHHLTINPHFDPSLPQVHAEYDSAYGTVTTDWDGAAHSFTVITPPNTTATVVLPQGKSEQIGSGRHDYRVQ